MPIISAAKSCKRDVVGLKVGKMVWSRGMPETGHLISLYYPGDAEHGI